MFWIVVISKVTIASAVSVLAELAFHRRVLRLAYSLWASVFLILVIPPIICVPVLDLLPADAALSETASAVEMLNSQVSLSRERIRGFKMPGELSTMLIGAWLAGTSCLLLRYTRRRKRLGDLLNIAEEASDGLQQRYLAIAREMKVNAIPKLVVAHGCFSPFLWHPLNETSYVVLPQQLVESLSVDSVDSIFRHELVHLRRCDSFRRFAQLAITAIWWWLPTAWLAQNRLRQLEEMCVDAEVVCLARSKAKDYAIGLLETDEFLAKTKPMKFCMVATFSDQRFLKRRIEGIVRQKGKPNSCSQLSTWGVGLLILPVALITAAVADAEIKDATTSKLVNRTYKPDSPGIESTSGEGSIGLKEAAGPKFASNAISNSTIRNLSPPGPPNPPSVSPPKPPSASLRK